MPETMSDLLAFLQPQMNDLKADIACVLKDTAYLREVAVKNATRLDEHERRIGKLENGTQKDGGATVALINLILSWIFRFTLAGAALVAGFNLEKIAQLLVK